jgi:hypothetical protein
MHEFQGDLLIGGARLKQIHGELANEAPPQGESHEWTLAGQLHLTVEQSGQLEVHRPYRLVLSDGRAGQVVFLRIDNDGQPNHMLANFQPTVSVHHV